MLDEKKKSPPIYVMDYLNVWSDYREIKYKKENIDFHSIKHINKEKDTFGFFELFFTKYINYAKININSKFIFVLKKITNYENILLQILDKYSFVDLRFIIIETKYNQVILDKNKDDFLCQYIFCFLIHNNDNCILISNDKYRDLLTYINKFEANAALIRILKLDLTKVRNTIMEVNFNQKLLSKDNLSKLTRCTIPKNKLHVIL
jgi:hypothetical protein